MAAEAGAGNGETPRRVLLLSNTDQPAGVDAAGAVNSVGYEVEEVGAFASMVDLLQQRGPDARTGAVILTDGYVGSIPKQHLANFFPLQPAFSSLKHIFSYINLLK